MHRRPTWILVALAAGLASPSGARAKEIDGAKVYSYTCNRCHEYRSPTEFTGPQWSIISTHMRVVGGIPADEARAVYEYLKSQHHPPYMAPPDPGAAALSIEPATGKRLVQQSGCVGCHVVGGQGGRMGPPLDGVSDRRAKPFVVQQLSDPKVNNPSSLMPQFGFAPAEIEAIWAYLQTLDGGDGS